MKAVRIFAAVLTLGFAHAAFADRDAALADYMSGGNSVMSQLSTLQKNAPSCGFVGRFVAGRMAESINSQRNQMARVSAAAKAGQRGPVEAALREVEEGNKELTGSSGMIRNGLSTNSPECKQASAAFERLYKVSLAMPGKLRRLISEM